MRSRCVAEVRLLGRRRRHRHTDELIAPSTRRSKRARIGERQPELARPTLCAQQYPCWSKSELVATRRTLKLWQRQVGVRGGPTNFDFEAIHSAARSTQEYSKGVNSKKTSLAFWPALFRSFS